MTQPALGSLLTAMLTPMKDDESLDLSEAKVLARYLIAQGNHGVVVSGTTGESPALSDAEKLALFSATKEAIGTTGTVIAGTSSNNTHHSVALTKQAEACGVDGILAVVPYYNKPTQDGMLRHFGAIAESTRLPIVIYNIPGRTGANMLPATLLALAQRYPNIVGVKESSGDVAQFSAILRERAPSFSFWSGDDHMFLPSLALGGDGLISVAAHLCGRELSDMHVAYASGDVAGAAQIHRDLSPLFAALFATTSPIPVKWAMAQLGFAVGPVRSPLGAMPSDIEERLTPLLAPFRDRARAALAVSAR
jgi:4-hydroxy-tetrahydrodipicolinate synthase